jgi:hypothetical protein
VDQTFPAILPAEGQSKCVKIIIVESGSVPDLIDEFRRQLGNRRVPPGSAVLVFSASHLVNVGLEQYTADLVAAKRVIDEKIGRETVFQPLPPILLDGTGSPELIRLIMELNTWMDEYYGSSATYLEEAHKVAREVMLDQGEGRIRELESRRYTLPADNPTGKRVWASGGDDCKAMPCKIKPLTHNMEMKAIISLIEELRGKLGMDLDTAPAFDRTLGSQTRPKKKCEYLLVGCSKIKEMAAILRNRGKVVSTMLSKDWMVNRSNVEKLTSVMRKQIEQQDPEVVVMELLDNSVFFGKQDDGSRILPRKGTDDIYHIEGEIQVCSREVQSEQFNMLKPLFDAAEGRKVIWMAPTPRFVTGSCCDSEQHITNRSDQYLREDMSIQLEALKRHMRDHAFYNCRKLRVFDPNQEIRPLNKEEAWGPDPVQLSAEAMSKVIDSLVKMVDGLNREMEEPGERQGQQRQQQQRGGPHHHHPRGGGRGRGRGRGYNPQGSYGNSSNSVGGRHYDPEQRYGGRGSRGGQYDYRARPY